MFMVGPIASQLLQRKALTDHLSAWTYGVGHLSVNHRNVLLN